MDEHKCDTGRLSSNESENESTWNSEWSASEPVAVAEVSACEEACNGADQQVSCLAVEAKVLPREKVVVASVVPGTLVRQRRRQPVDLVAVIDVSGSMSGEQLTLVAESLNYLVSQMSSGSTEEDVVPDRLCIVTFSNESQVLLPLTNMGASGKALAKERVKSMSASGGTNLSAGMFRAFEQLDNRTMPRPVASLIVLTDGLSNRGIIDGRKLAMGVKQYIKKLNQPISIFTLGVGVGHDPADLCMLSELGEGGVYNFLQDAEGIPRYFEKCLGGLFSITAQNIRLTYDSRFYRLLSPNRSVASSGNDQEIATTLDPKSYIRTVQLGDIYADERKDIVFLVKKNGDMQTSLSGPLFEVFYFDVARLQPVEAKCSLSWEVSENESVALLSAYDRMLALRAISYATKHGITKDSKILLQKSVAKLRSGQAFKSGDVLSRNMVADLEAVLTELGTTAAVFDGPASRSASCANTEQSCTLHILLSLSNQYQMNRYLGEMNCRNKGTDDSHRSERAHYINEPDHRISWPSKRPIVGRDSAPSVGERTNDVLGMRRPTFSLSDSALEQRVDSGTFSSGQQLENILSNKNPCLDGCSIKPKPSKKSDDSSSVPPLGKRKSHLTSFLPRWLRAVTAPSS